jgi:hypothetical protein
MLPVQLSCVCLFALEVSTGPNGSNVQAVHALGYTGQGVGVGLICQDHARTTHEAFAVHAHWFDATDQDNYVPSNHDTSVGGIVCSRGGAAYPNDKGAAPDAELYSVKIFRQNDAGNYLAAIPWFDSAFRYLLEQGCQVVVTAIQLGDTADGASDWSLIYDYYAYQHNLVFAAAAGNYYSNVTIFGDSYNSITTGGLLINADNNYYRIGTLSNSGLTVDGRRKPDICAPSQAQWTPRAGSDTSWAAATPDGSGETSWAAPQTGGVAAALLSYANASAETADGKNQVIKAVIVNSALANIQDKSGNGTIDFSNANWPWHKDRGYGRIDAQRAYELLSSPRITPSTSTANPKGWAFDAAAAGQQDRYWVAGQKNARLVVTLPWNRRVKWTDSNSPRSLKGVIEAGELEAFLANLDLAIYDPAGTRLPGVSSTIDNLEKVDARLSLTGNYEIRVVNQSASESADYAMAFEVWPPLEEDFNGDYAVNELDLAELAAYWLSSDCLNAAQPCFEYNLVPDQRINTLDFDAFAAQWLTFDRRYYSP